MDPIIDAAALATIAPRVLFDARTGPQARAGFAAGHLEGAIFVDLDRDLARAAPDASEGGRHPLPPAAELAAQLGRWGVTPASHVVIYDDQQGANAAARLWWMLRALGHERVQVLDGGLQAAVAAGLPLTTEVRAPAAAPPYSTAGYAAATASIDEVDALRLRPDARLLDVRSAARYRGDHEPIDPIAGHIPGALNVPFTDNLLDGRFKPAAALRALYQPVLGGLPPSALTVHCGSGVTACHTLLALERAGLHGARLYVGSWSEWCRQPGRPRAP